jgi:predicted dehydrogenase
MLGMPGLMIRAAGSTGAPGPNDNVRVAVIGMGDTKAKGGVGGRGHQLIPRIREIPGAKIVALCDIDPRFLDREAQLLKSDGETVATYNDPRQVFDDRTIDAVVIALPNHWHALATIWACQAGKDVYVEKPFSYNLWEGQQMVAAARKYGRMVQVGTQSRSSTLLREAFEYVRGGQLGAIRYAHALVYRPRDGLGKVDAPTPVPADVNYDLWCGPAPKAPLMRKQLNYEWHWFWATGNGEIGNNGIHVIDICRWALGQNQLPSRTLSIGGRFGYGDCGETANTQIAVLDYQPAPLVCEVRNLSVGKGAIGTYRDRNHGILIDCEGGSFLGDATGGTILDTKGKTIKAMKPEGSAQALETAHLTAFVTAVRSRKKEDLAAEALDGHRSAACCHLANISHRIGKQTSPEAIHSSLSASSELTDAFERCREYLRANGADLAATQATLGPWVTLDPLKEQFVGECAAEASALARRQYREPFVIPEVV